MRAYRLLSLLLQYPGRELVEGGADLAAEVERLPAGEACDAVGAFLAGVEPVPLAELQSEYVVTFDFDRRASLYLTYHSHGDRRQRGVELVKLKRRFAETGLALAEGELPDYLPALLEFAALAPDRKGEEVLVGLRAPLELVRSRLHERGSRYAGLLDAVAASLPPLTRAQAERARRLAEEGPPGELVGLEPVGLEPVAVPPEPEAVR